MENNNSTERKANQKRIELVVVSNDTTCSKHDLQELVKDTLSGLQGASIENDFTIETRSAEVDIAVGFLISIASGLTVELILQLVRENIEKRRLSAQAEASEIEDKDETDDDAEA